MKIAILDDYANVVRDLPCFRKLAGHDVTVWNDQTADQDVLAERLADTENPGPPARAHGHSCPADRSAAEAQADQPTQRLSAHRHRCLHAPRHPGLLDDAADDRVPCGGRAHLGADHRLDATHPAGKRGAQGRPLAIERRPGHAGLDARHLRLRPHRGAAGALCQGFRDEFHGMGPRGLAEPRARRRGRDR